MNLLKNEGFGLYNDEYYPHKTPVSALVMCNRYYKWKNRKFTFIPVVKRNLEDGKFFYELGGK